uniref:Carboxypeptidase A inhibitor-like domain-containing protein n=1 Tax=Litorilinea aerophila TaxID=1204385 RepID=A0A540VKM8_9CHLR
MIWGPPQVSCTRASVCTGLTFCQWCTSHVSGSPWSLRIWSMRRSTSAYCSSRMRRG